MKLFKLNSTTLLKGLVAATTLMTGILVMTRQYPASKSTQVTPTPPTKLKNGLNTIVETAEPKTATHACDNIDEELMTWMSAISR